MPDEIDGELYRILLGRQPELAVIHHTTACLEDVAPPARGNTSFEGWVKFFRSALEDEGFTSESDYKTKHHADAECLDAFVIANSQRWPLASLGEFNLVDTDLYPSHQDACSTVPNCTGWWRFSSIGYNASRSQAILHEDYDHPKWGLMGMGHFVLLEQSQQQWRVVAKHMTWMS